MDWKAEIEAAVQEGVKAAFERYAPVEEPTDELARRRRRRIELAEDRARRDPVWAEKMARRHAAFADAMATSTSSASASVKPQAVSSRVDIDATTPGTCSTQCPSRSITVSVSAIIPSATPTPSTTTGGTTGVIVLERCCFEPDPACAISTTISTPDEMSQANFYDDTPYAGWAAALAVGEHDDDESTSSATTSASNPDESPASSAVCAIDGPPPSAVPRGTTSSGCARTAMHEGEDDLICAAPSKCNSVIAQLGSSSTHVSALTDSAVTMLAPNAGTAMVCEDGQHLEATVCTFGLPPSTAPPTETMVIKPGASATNATSLPVACLTLSCEGDTDRTASAVPVAKEDHHLSIDTSESVFILPTLDCSSTNKAKLVPIITKEQDNSPLMSCLLQAHSPRTEPHIQLMYVGQNLDFQSVTHHVRQVLPWDPGQPWCGKGKLSTSEDGLASGVIICLQENSVHELFCCSAVVDAITKYKNVAPRLLSEVEIVLWPRCQSTSRDTILLQPWDPGLLLSVMDNKLQPQPSWGLSVLILSLASQAIYASGNWCYLNCPPRSPDQAIPHWVLVNCDSTSMHFQWAIAVQKWNSRYIWRGNTHFSQLMEWSLQSEFGVFTPGNILLYYYVLVQWEIPRTVILASWKFWLQYCSAGHESLRYHYALSSLQTLSACALLFVQQNYLTICKERWFRFLIGFRIICYNMLSSSNSNCSSSERFVMEHWLMPRNSGDVLVHVLPLTRPHAHVPISPADDDSFSYVLVLGQECITCGHSLKMPPSLMPEAYMEFSIGPNVSTMAPWPPPSCTRAGPSLIFGHDLCHNEQQKRSEEFSVMDSKENWNAIWLRVELKPPWLSLDVEHDNNKDMNSWYDPLPSLGHVQFSLHCLFGTVQNPNGIMSTTSCLEVHILDAISISLSTSTLMHVGKFCLLLGQFSSCDQFVPESATDLGSQLFEWQIPWYSGLCSAIFSSNWLQMQPVGGHLKFNVDITSTIDSMPSIKHVSGMFSFALQYWEVVNYFAAAMLLMSSQLSEGWVLYLPVTCIMQCRSELMPWVLANSRDGILTYTKRVLIFQDPGGSVLVLHAGTGVNGNSSQQPFLLLTWDPGGYMQHRLEGKPNLKEGGIVNDPFRKRPGPDGGLPSNGFGPAQKLREEHYKREADDYDQLGLERTASASSLLSPLLSSSPSSGAPPLPVIA